VTCAIWGPASTLPFWPPTFLRVPIVSSSSTSKEQRALWQRGHVSRRASQRCGSARWFCRSWLSHFVDIISFLRARGASSLQTSSARRCIPRLPTSATISYAPSLAPALDIRSLGYFMQHSANFHEPSLCRFSRRIPFVLGVVTGVAFADIL
jgi:hypothetical protein